MRGKIVLGLAVMVAACSPRTDAPPSASEAATDAGAAETTPTAPGQPRTGITAAPGIGLRYGYEFLIPADRIARAQEAHASACEALGPARCRILGLHYQVGREPSDISGTLDLRLDPAIARRFGKDAADAVAKNGGTLGTVDIVGTDASAAIKAIDRATTRQRDERAQIEARLASLPPRARERTELAEQVRALRESLSASADDKQAQQQDLAVTPMHIDYQAADLIAGLDPHSLAGGIASISWQAFTGAVTLLAILLAVGLPWGLVGFGIWWLWRQIRARLSVG